MLAKESLLLELLTEKSLIEGKIDILLKFKNDPGTLTFKCADVKPSTTCPDPVKYHDIINANRSIDIDVKKAININYGKHVIEDTLGHLYKRHDELSESISKLIVSDSEDK